MHALEWHQQSSIASGARWCTYNKRERDFDGHLYRLQNICAALFVGGRRSDFNYDCVRLNARS
jgi:hypothetical protein